jgi:hypothetical protein
MPSRKLLAAAAAATLAFTAPAAWAQGNDANATAGNAVVDVAPADATTANGAAPAAPAAAAPADATADTAPHPKYMVEHGFPWGVLGLIGLVGLIPLFRRRDS